MTNDDKHLVLTCYKYELNDGTRKEMAKKFRSIKMDLDLEAPQACEDHKLSYIERNHDLKKLNQFDLQMFISFTI